MKFRVRFTEDAAADVERLQAFLLERADGDPRPAAAALEALRRGVAQLETSPFASRRIAGGDGFLRELVVGFGATGYVLLFRIEHGGVLTIAAARHQREDDYR